MHGAQFGVSASISVLRKIDIGGGCGVDVQGSLSAKNIVPVNMPEEKPKVHVEEPECSWVGGESSRLSGRLRANRETFHIAIRED